MLSLEQYQIIKEQLSKETASEFVREIIDSYSSTVNNASELLSYIPQIANKQLQIKQEKINQYSWATDCIIADRYSHPGKYTKKDIHGKFCTLFYTCKVHFPIGNADKDSIAGKSFFNEFVDMLKNKIEFDYTSEDDWDWIYSIAGGADWLESVINQNIDNKFVKPKDKIFRTKDIHYETSIPSV